VERAEYIKWAKDRAINILDTGDINGAWASMASDISNRQDAQDTTAILLGTQLMAGGKLSTVDQMRDFINGF